MRNIKHIQFEFKLDMYIKGHRRMNPIDLGEYRMNGVFYRSTKANSFFITAYGIKFFKVF